MNATDYDINDLRLFAAAHRMKREGGHFASRIADAYFYADSGNKKLLLAAFGHLFERFIEKGEDTEQN